MKQNTHLLAQVAISAGREASSCEAEPRAAAAKPRGPRPALPLDREAQVLLARVEVEVDHVAQRGAVDGEDAVAGAQAGPAPPPSAASPRPPPRPPSTSPIRPPGHGQTRPLTEVGVSSCLSPRMMYCSPEVIVKTAVTQARSW